MRTSLKLLLPLILLCSYLAGQTQTVIQPPCVQNFALNGTTQVVSPNFSNSVPSCDKWTLTVYSVGFSAFTLTLQSAPALTTTTPGTFITYPGATVTGSNPITATGIATFTNGTIATPWLRVAISGISGSGTVYGVLQGSQTLISKSGGGGGGSGYTTIENTGTPLPQRSVLNFLGGSCVDDAGNARTNCPVGMGSSLPIFVNGSLIGTANELFFQAGPDVTLAGLLAGANEVQLTITANNGAWVDPVASFNASGQGLTTTTGTVNTAAPTALTLASGATWSSGMGIQVIGAGPAGGDLITTCATVVGTACTLTTGASTSRVSAVVLHDDTAAIQAAFNASSLVHLRAGTYNVSSAITIATPGQIVGDGQGLTFIQITAVTNSTGYFVVNTNISGSTTGQDNLGQTIKQMTINQDPSIPPTSGFAIYVTSTGGGGTFVTTLHLEDITINNTYSGIFFGSGAIQNWVERMHIRYLQNGGAAGQSGIVVNSPSPSGDTHWIANELNGPNSGLLIINADTQSFTDLKINNTGVVINAASNLSVRRIRFDDASIEGTNGTGVPSCEVSIGANSNTTDQISFTGGGIGLSPNGICATNTLALNVANVFFYNTTNQITASGSFGSVIGNTFSSEPSSTTATAVNLTNSSSFIVTDNVIESGAFGVVTDSSIAKIFNLNSNVNQNSVANNLNAATTDFEFLATPPTCAADGSHALTFPSGSFSCTPISGGGSGGGGVLGYSATALTLPTAGTTFLAPVGGALASTTEANVTASAPAAAAISMMYVSLSSAPGAGNSIAFTYRDAGSSTPLTCTISGATATTCNDVTHSFTPTVGDAISVQVVTTGTVVIAPAIKIIAEYGVSGGGSSTGMLASFFTPNSETTSSTSAVDLTTPDTITFTLSATTNVVINYLCYSTLTNVPDGLFNELNVDGTLVPASIFECDSFNGGGKYMCGLGYKVSLGSGSHTIKVQHFVGSSTTGSWANRLTQAFSSP